MRFTSLFSCSLLVASTLSATIPSELTAIEARENEHGVQIISTRNALEPRFINLLMSYLGVKAVVSGVNLLVSFGGLISGGFGLVECGAGTGNCVQAVFDVLMGTWGFVYTAAVGRAETSEHGGLLYGYSQTDHTFESHIPIGANQNLKKAAIATGNNGTWHHVVTFNHATAGTYLLHYRLASDDDLGLQNDGSYYHFRAHKAGLVLNARKNDEDSVGGVVGDYIWKDNEKELWEMFNDINSDAVGNTLSEWMLDNKEIASCAVPTIDGVSGYGSEDHVEGVDQGVVAYGWNNKPFNFNGRSGGWVDECVVPGGTPLNLVNP